MDKKNEKNNSVSEKKMKIKKKFSGLVVGDKMDKTIVVRVDRVKINKKYKKRYTVSRKYKVHDEKGFYKIDDQVEFIECRPLSKNKRWRVLYGEEARGQIINYTGISI